eukprot:11198374-Lingulodinium_polyedra.AAC.1
MIRRPYRRQPRPTSDRCQNQRSSTSHRPAPNRGTKTHCANEMAQRMRELHSFSNDCAPTPPPPTTAG